MKAKNVSWQGSVPQFEYDEMDLEGTPYISTPHYQEVIKKYGYRVGYCPQCNHTLYNKFLYVDHFCSQCGQEIEWDEE